MATLFEALGNVADIPGGAIRNLISGNNPLAPLLDPFGQSGRASGQEVLDAWGLGPDHSTLGFGLELATDPLTYLGAGLVNKGAKALGLVSKTKNVASAAKTMAQYAARNPGNAKLVAGTLAKKLSNNFVPFVQSIPGAAERAAFSTPVRQLAGGAALVKLLTEGRASDDDIVNGYLGNNR